MDGDAHLRKRHARALAHAAADQFVHARLPELAGQRAVACAVPLEDAFGPDRAVLHLVEFELAGMAKVLKDVSIFIGNRDLHV